MYRSYSTVDAAVRGAQNDLLACRAAIANLIRDTDDSVLLAKRLNDYVMQLAEHEGALGVYAEAQIAEAWFGADDPVKTAAEKKAIAQKQIMRATFRGPDDQWSGNGNEVKRATFSGVLSATENVLEIWGE